MDAPMLQIGTVVDEESAGNISECIIAVMEAAYECHLDQETTRCAITAASRALKVENVTVSHSNFRNEA